MSAARDGGMAFPFGNHETGMTLRDYFAAKAMQAYITGCITAGIGWSPAEVAKEANVIADSMIAARSA